MMRKVGLITIISLLLLVAIFGQAQSVKLPDQSAGPTQQQQTLDAIVRARLELTLTASALAPTQVTPSLEPTVPPKTATAIMEATVAQALDLALSATAAASRPMILAQVIGGQSVNLRSCPTTTCSVVGVLPSGAEVSIIGQVPDWYYVVAGEIEGYVFSGLLTTTDSDALDGLPPPPPSPTPSPVPTATPDVSLTATYEALGSLVTRRGDGYYVVGTDILPGRWESQGVGASCYWARVDKYNDVIDNHFGEAGGTITVQASDFALNIERCGQIAYVEGQPAVLLPTAYDAKDSGFYTVGVEIAPGSWRSNGQGGGCYWERLDRFQEINSNYYGSAGTVVYVTPGDYEVHFSNCGQFTFIGP